VKQLIIVKIVTAIMKIETAEITKPIFKILLSFRFFNSFSSESIIPYSNILTSYIIYFKKANLINY